MKPCDLLPTISCLSFPCSAGGVDFEASIQNVTFTQGNSFAVANIVIFDDLILEIDEDFVAHLVVTNDTLNGRVTAGDINDVIVTILDDEGKQQFIHSGS